MTGRAGAPRCPYCESRDTEAVSLFGMGEMTMQRECRACGATFESVKWA